MKTCCIFLLPLLFIVCMGCQPDDLNTDGFQPVTEQMVYNNLIPAQSHDFFEFRTVFCGQTDGYLVDYSFGEACLNAEDGNSCLDLLAATAPETVGFNVGCLPACCSSYAVTESAGVIDLIDELNELSLFLGPVDSISDALVWVQAHGYYFAFDDINRSAIQERSEGYRITALQLVSDCAPVLVKQYVLSVSAEGLIRVLEEKEESRLENACI